MPAQVREFALPCAVRHMALADRPLTEKSLVLDGHVQPYETDLNSCRSVDALFEEARFDRDKVIVPMTGSFFVRQGRGHPRARSRRSSRTAARTPARHQG